MKMLLMSIVVISCSSGNIKPEIIKSNIEISGLQTSYSKLNSVKFTVISNIDKKTSFHLEGLFYDRSGWREFDNDLLSEIERKSETELWLEPNGHSEIEITPEKLLKKFTEINIPDSFKIRVAYRIGEDNTRKSAYSNSFIMK